MVPGDRAAGAGTWIASDRGKFEPPWNAQEISMNKPMQVPSQGAKYAIYYITAGALVIIWAIAAPAVSKTCM